MFYYGRRRTTIPPMKADLQEPPSHTAHKGECVYCPQTTATLFQHSSAIAIMPAETSLYSSGGDNHGQHNSETAR